MSGQPADRARTNGELAGKYLTFDLAGDEYGLPVLTVREIIRMMSITAVPQVPGHVRGVINLRGKIVPVVDLRARLGFPALAYTERTCIIVVEIATAATRVPMGVIVDRVSEVLSIAPGEIEPMPDFGDGVRASNVKAVAKVKGQVKVLVDLDRVLGAEGQTLAQSLEAQR
jgi:purine-binding chemotaxis protein CheW